MKPKPFKVCLVYPHWCLVFLRSTPKTHTVSLHIFIQFTFLNKLPAYVLFSSALLSFFKQKKEVTNWRMSSCCPEPGRGWGEAGERRAPSAIFTSAARTCWNTLSKRVCSERPRCSHTLAGAASAAAAHWMLPTATERLMGRLVKSHFDKYLINATCYVHNTLSLRA